MPRSGSTLIQNILGNHPEFYASPTSGLFDLLNASKHSYTKSPVIKAQDELVMKKAFLTYCRYGLQGFYEGITEKKYVIDKSRAWMINVAWLEAFYDNPKIICMIRDLRGIVASMEKNYRKHYDKWDETNNYESPKGMSIMNRVRMWLRPESRPVGDTLVRLKESIHRGFSNQILFVKYENLLQNPERQMRRIHNYLDIPYFDYDFNNIKQVTHEDDRFHGKYGNHRIQSQIKPVNEKYENILGNEVCDYIQEDYEWYFKNFNY